MIRRMKYHRDPERKIRLSSATLGRRAAETLPDEHLEGVVQGMPASVPEERVARALSKNVNITEFRFRVPVGGARNTPGWKELDFLIHSITELYYMVEVDSAFSHREKQNADVLHDAILIKELEPLGVYPHVFHWSLEHDLASQSMADETARRLFG